MHERLHTEWECKCTKREEKEQRKKEAFFRFWYIAKIKEYEEDLQLEAYKRCANSWAPPVFIDLTEVEIISITIWID